MNNRPTNIRTKHLESYNSYDAEPRKKMYSVRRRAGNTAASAKNIATEPVCPIEEPLRKSTLYNKSDKNIRGRILLPRSKHLPQNFFDERLFLRSDRNSSKQKEESPKETNVDTPTFRQIADITFCDEFKIEEPKEPRKFGKSEVLRRKQVDNQDKENQPLLANLLENPLSIRRSLMLRRHTQHQQQKAKGQTRNTIFQSKVSLFEEQMPLKQRINYNPSQTRTRRLKLGSYLPQLKLRNIS